MEVRKAYAESDFEWDSCERVSVRDLHDANLSVMRDHAQRKFGWSKDAGEAEELDTGTGES